VYNWAYWLGIYYDNCECSWNLCQAVGNW
jgi:hypothetical protein